MEKYTNDLISESSPYLLQHAHNPVNWIPWSDDVFKLAKEQNKLVLISIGYSSCHWCHVMERESFEDEEVAALMNKFFINVKIDREERPDIDQVYMTAVQLMTQRGGWPLNCVTLPNGDPIYGGTYFPKDQWLHVLKSLAFTYKDEPEKVIDYGKDVREGVQRSEQVFEKAELEIFQEAHLQEMIQRWSKNFDLNHGGKSSAPKFPLPSNYEFLMDYALLSGNGEVKEYVYTSLKRMAQGGIYDQIGGGFSRYSVDMLWKVPHFEKMLYDNAQLLGLYAKAFLVFQDEQFKRAAEGIVQWLEREMHDDSGAFYSAMDADSEGIEGKFYVWTKDELKGILGDEFEWVQKYYCVDQRGYWEDDNYILLRRSDDLVFANEMSWSLEELYKKVEKVNLLLLEVRNKRIYPSIDTKCLTSWNALLVKGLSEAAAAFNKEDYHLLAKRILHWLQKFQMNEDLEIVRTYSAGKSKISGFLDDYALVISSLIEFYKIDHDEKWIGLAKSLLDKTIERFYDEESGMFFYTNEDSSLIARKMEISDNVIPASNSVMARNLYYLASYFDHREYKNMAVQMLKNVYDGMEMYGSAYSNWGMLLLHELFGLYEIIIKEDEAKLKQIQQFPLPYVLTSLVGERSKIPLVQSKVEDDRYSIFVCTTGTCFAPTNDVTEVINHVIQ